MFILTANHELPMPVKNLIKLLFILFLVLTGTYISYHINGKSFIGIDDANIYMIYMRNVANGHGFVYDVGGERVEGFTSTLWCIIGAVGYLFSNHIHFGLLIINILVVTFSLWRLVVFVDEFYGEKQTLTPPSLFILGALLVLPGYIDWTVLTLMETGIWSSLLTFSFLNFFRWETQRQKRTILDRQLAFLLFFLVLARPESYLWGLVFVLYRMLRYFQISDSILFMIKKNWGIAGSYTGTIVGLTLWRISYFGYPLPNTYYAKVSGDRWYNLSEGFNYIWHFIQTTNIFLLFILGFMLLYFLFKKRDTHLQVALVATIAVVVTAIIPLYSGGDHFAWGRVIQPTLPIIYFAFTLYISRIIKEEYSTSFRYIFVLMFLVLFFVLPVKKRWIDGILVRWGDIRYEFEIARDERIFGWRLGEFFKEMEILPSQGVLTAGGNAYHYPGKTIDLLGLNNVAMAHADKIKDRGLLKNHASFNKDVFYQLKPDMVWMSYQRFMPTGDTAKVVIPEKSREEPYSLIDWVYKGIIYDSKFRETYYPVLIFKEGDNEFLFTYVHKDFLRRLSVKPYNYRRLK